MYSSYVASNTVFDALSGVDLQMRSLLAQYLTDHSHIMIWAMCS